MLKKELAALLNISPAMVSRLAKRGMPTDNLERAQRWRKRHLEPGRVKGSRYDPNVTDTGQTLPPGTAGAGGAASLARAERHASATGEALAGGDVIEAAAMLDKMRALLRRLPGDARPRMPLLVWLALVDWVLIDDAHVRQAPDQAAVLDSAEFCARVRPDTSPGLANHWLELACDWKGFSVAGLPADFEYNATENAT